jgi:hypothetical protein
MPAPVCNGARMQCSYGAGESELQVSKRGMRHSGDDRELATVEDCVPLVNIPPFRSCTAPANPYPANPSGNKPCTPRFSSCWSDEIEGIMLFGQKPIEQRATLACDYGGTIRLSDAGQQEASIRDNMLRYPSSFMTLGAQNSGSAGSGRAAGGGSGGGSGGRGGRGSAGSDKGGGT